MRAGLDKRDRRGDFGKKNFFKIHVTHTQSQPHTIRKGIRERKTQKTESLDYSVCLAPVTTFLSILNVP